MMRAIPPVLALLLAACGGAGAGTQETEPASAPAAAAAMGDPAATTDDSACLPYGPDTVAVTGVLEWQTYPGPPSHGESPDDEQQRHFYIVPDAPLCTRAGRPPPNDPGQKIELVQMMPDSAGYARLRPHRDRRVRATGTLSRQSAGHHHAPVLLRAHAIEPVDGPR